MKIGYLTSFSQDEIARAGKLGFDCLEPHSGSWGGDGVYASSEERQRILDDLKKGRDAGIAVTAIAHYGPSLHLKGKEFIDSFSKAVQIARGCQANIVTAIAARENPEKTVADNIPAYKTVYSEVARIAEGEGVKVAFENWPGFRGYPLKGITMAYNPDSWERMFDAVPSAALGLEFDPSHLYWQGIDHIAALKKFANRVFHVHAKDTEIFRDRRNAFGIYSGEEWWTYRIPGLGEIDWRAFIAELHTLNYAGGVCIEHEDFRFDCLRKEATPAKFEEGLRIGLATLRPLIG
ncbi:MAG TPA: sugar phosphate isomerase/epimerase [Tepidisphaeraceae bacterium]|jgi:sugar phosphate isomerase/epimerase|nr:sugar phosphate isomerase/epimerase [Tepidisphaeraceae bacterium]